jgi:capsular polysaccharide biosynthesis protein
LRLLARLATENEDFKRARELCAELLEKCPDDEAALRVLGRLSLAAGDTDRAIGCFERHARLTLGPRALTRLYRQQHLDLERAKQKIPYYRVLDDVLVDTAYWSIMTDSGVVYSRDVHGRNLAKSPFVQGRVSSDDQCVVASYLEPQVTVSQECIFVGGDENYSHWLFRNLLKLVALEDDRLVDGLPWLLNRDLKPWQLEYLDMFGVRAPRRILVERGQVIRCRKLVTPALLTNAAPIAAGIKWIHKRLAAYMAPPAEADALIYVSRADARFRHLLNENELFERLQPLGFRLVVPGRLGVAEQIREFSGARIVVAVHGAALTNIVFTRHDTAIVEINSSVLARMDDFRRIARAREQHMATVISDNYADAREAIHVNSDYYVNVNEIVREVDRCLQARTNQRFVTAIGPGAKA